MNGLSQAATESILRVGLRLRSRLPRLVKRDERGSVTIEQVLWAVAVIAFAGIVIAAIKAFVESQAGNIK